MPLREVRGQRAPAVPSPSMWLREEAGGAGSVSCGPSMSSGAAGAGCILLTAREELRARIPRPWPQAGAALAPWARGHPSHGEREGTGTCPTLFFASRRSILPTAPGQGVGTASPQVSRRAVCTCFLGKVGTVSCSSCFSWDFSCLGGGHQPRICGLDANGGQGRGRNVNSWASASHFRPGSSPTSL